MVASFHIGLWLAVLGTSRYGSGSGHGIVLEIIATFTLKN
jgi:hypothetical protein